VPAVPAAPNRADWQPLPTAPAPTSGAESTGQAATLQAPAHWQVVDLLSDLHLCPALPHTLRAFEAHLASTPADAVLILGDLFEVWVGPEQAERPFDGQCLARLAACAQDTWVGFMPGNRDFLLDAATLRRHGVHLLADPTCLEIFGRRWLLTHGDALCLEDHEYQAFRRTVRQPAWQRDFLARPLPEREALAGRIRQESQARKSRAPSPAEWADVDSQAAVDGLKAAKATVMIHGHTHRPGRCALDTDLERQVLSDWDLDAGAPRGDVLRLSPAGLQRLPVVPPAS
jgi:UDP-2,3-diacylglucosamine hydrolase